MSRRHSAPWLSPEHTYERISSLIYWTRMRVLATVLALAAVASAVPRVRRQAEPEVYCNNNRDICVPYYLCRDGIVITDGSGLIDIRIKPRLGGNNTSATRSGTPEPARSSATEFISECPSFLDVCCTDPTRKPPPPPKYVAQCGRRNEEGVNARIVDFPANQAQFGEFPWMAAVLRTEYSEDNVEEKHYVCGGSLIHPQVVLTAAHCVYNINPTTLNVRLGEWDTQKAYELYPHQDRNVGYVVTHREFNHINLFNDFALLFLDSPVELAPNVDTVCLPEQGQTFDGSYCWATGWGKDRFGKEGVFQNVLKEVELPIVSQYDCQESLRTTRLGKLFKLHPSFTCAGGIAGVDTCTGDGGSPLVCLGLGNSYVQTGIVAWGIGCGEDNVPGVYANVPAFVNWIKDNVNSILLQEFNYDNKNYW